MIQLKFCRLLARPNSGREVRDIGETCGLDLARLGLGVDSFPMRAEPINRRTLPAVTCPGCRVKMEPVVVNSLPADRIDITYRCDKCGFETDRVIRVRGH